MDNKDKKILEDHDRFMKKVLKAVERQPFFRQIYSEQE